MKAECDTGADGRAAQTSAVRAVTLNPRRCNYQPAESGSGGALDVLFRRPRNFTFHPSHPQAAPAAAAFYPIFQCYKLILISARAHAGLPRPREGRVGFIGIRVTRCDVIVADSSALDRKRHPLMAFFRVAKSRPRSR